MKPQNTCSTKRTEDYRYHRMHYCGTCKTLGQAYGQRTRMLLNFDTVFFAEILSHLSEEKLSDWQDGYQAINRCFTMPEDEQPIPLSLSYAAATNVLFAELKLDDNQKDSPHLAWSLGQRFFSEAFHKATAQFEAWGMNTQVLWDLVNEQEALEKATPFKANDLTEMLTHYAEPTARMTGLLFEHSASVVGQEKQDQTMYQLGYRFGQLVYILDAFEDVEKDIVERQFNPIVLHFKAKQQLSKHQLDKAQQVIFRCQEFVTQEINALPFTTEIIEQYSVRLYSNIVQRIYKAQEAPKTRKEQVHDLSNTFTATINKIALHWAFQIRQTNHYLVAMIAPILLLAGHYLSEGDAIMVYQWIAILTGVLGSVAFTKHLWTKGRNEPTKGDNGGYTCPPGISDCCSECCADCCQACCDYMCDSCCDICRESIANREIWVWVVLGIVVLFALVLTLILVLV